MTSELRCASSEIKTVKFANAVTNATHAKNVLQLLGGADPKMIGFFIADVGTSGQAKDDDYRNGNKGVFVYEARAVLVDKITGSGHSFVPGDPVYWNNVTATGNQVTEVATNNSKCGKALETVATTATQVLIDLIVLN